MDVFFTPTKYYRAKITIPLVWFFTIILSTTAFARFTTKLTAEGEAIIQKHIYDYVYIEHVEISGSSNGVDMYYSFEDHEIKSTTNIGTCNGYVEYALDVVNTTPYKAFITQTQVKSMISGSGSNTDSMSVEFTDIAANETYIEPHSTKTIHVRIKNNCTGNDSVVTSTVNFEYSLYKYFDLTVTANQSDATVKITTQEGTFTGIGTITHRVGEGDTVNYIASKPRYYDVTGIYTMGQEDHTINVTMTPDSRRELVVNVTMTNNSSRTRVYNQVEGTPTIVATSSGSPLTPTSGDNTFMIEAGKSVTVMVSEPEYYYTASGSKYNDYSNTFTISNDTTLNVELKEKPYITGIIQNTNRTTAKTKTDTNYHSGYYLIEVWGGLGGKGSSDTKGNPSGYVYGYIYLTNGTSVYSTAGGNGADKAQNASGGANGGGAAGSTAANQGGGGGYSAFAMNATTINSTNINNGNVLFIAGGGGGGAGAPASGSAPANSGGSGGTLNTTSSKISIGTVFSGTAGLSPTTNTTNGAGGGGSTKAGAHNGSGNDGSLLTGGTGAQRSGGGGAGYYGGAGGGWVRYSYGPGGGGGGSSFISNKVTYSGIESSLSQYLLGTNPSTTGGSVVITFIGKTL